MTEFWFNVVWTTLIALATVLSDWIAAKFVSLTRGLSAIQKAVDQAVADTKKIEHIKAEIERVEKRARSHLIWGADLVTVAIGLDLGVLSLWTNDKTLFTFFQRWNTQAANREIQLWLVIIVVHLSALLASIVFKHLHSDHIESIPVADLVSPSSVGRWLLQSRWLLTCNTLGFVCLLSTFVIITNSL